MYKRMLVPLDGSALAEGVLSHAQGLAKSCGAELVLLRVAFAHTLLGADPMQAQMNAVQEAEAYIQGVAKTFLDRGLKVEAKVRYGEPLEEILDHVIWDHIDLIAMATHGRTGLKRLVLGSVAENVLRRSSVPVLLVRPSVAPEP